MAMPVAFELPTVRLNVGRLKVVAGVLAVGIAVAAAGGSLTHSSTNASAAAPASLQSAITATLGAHAAAYAVTHRGDTLVSHGGGLSTVFTSAGPVVRVGGTELGLSFSGIGYGVQLARPGQVAPTAKANEVSYRHAGVTEWYRNGPLGLEQGFTLARQPAGDAANGSLTLALRTSGAAQLSQHGSVVRISGGGTYSGLTAFDAAGHKLPSTLVLQHGTLLLRVKDAGARYPLTIDPIIGDSQMNAMSYNSSPGPVGAGAVGTSISLSADGTEALVGAPADNGGVGAAWVFMLTDNGAWNYGAKLTATGETGAGAFGSSVSLSSDGSRALVGAPGDANIGAAWSFTITVDSSDPGYPVATATQENMFTGAGQDNYQSPNGARYGAAVALSGDGTTALIGATRDAINPPGIHPGSVWAYKLTSGTWTQQGSKFAPTGGTAAFLLFGNSIALSDNGDTAVIGGPADGNGPGAAWVFTRTGTTWTQQGTKLTANDESGSGHFGVSVALSNDGNTALIGAPNDNGNLGAAWAFTRSGTTWSQQGSKLVGDDENDASQFGTSVALSGTGDVALVGGPHDQGDTGAAWLYVRSSGAWAQEGAKQSGAGFGTSASGNGTQTAGTSVALSDNGLASALGSPTDSDGEGSVLAFQVIAPTAPTSVTASAFDGGAEVQIDGDASAFTSYTVTASPGGATATGAAMMFGTWLDVMGLTNGVEYTFTVTATNQLGTSGLSAPSNPVTPFAAPAPTPDPTPAPAVDPTPAPVVTPPVVTPPVVIPPVVRVPLVTPAEQKAINVAQRSVTTEAKSLTKAEGQLEAAVKKAVIAKKQADASINKVAAPSATATEKKHVVTTVTSLVDERAASAKKVAAAKAAALKASEGQDAARGAATIAAGKLAEAKARAKPDQAAIDAAKKKADAARAVVTTKTVAAATANAKVTKTQTTARADDRAAEAEVHAAVVTVSAGRATKGEETHVVATVTTSVVAKNNASDKETEAEVAARKLRAAKAKLAATKAAAIKP